MKWTPAACVFGPGLASVTPDGVPVLLGPYVAGDGSGRVAGYGLMLGYASLGRFPGDLAAAIAAAEEILGPAFSDTTTTDRRVA